MMQQQMAGLRAALSGDPGDDIVVLAMLLVEQAIKIRRGDDGDGTPAEIKRYITELTGELVDVVY